MAAFKLTVSYNKRSLSISNKAMGQTAERAEIIARNSILKNSRAGTDWPNLPFRSSAPFGAPASQSGALASAIKGEIVPRGKGIVEVILKVDGRKRDLRRVSVKDYAATQEFGFAKMNVKERPYLAPALQEAFENYKIKPSDYIDSRRITRTFNYR